MGHGDWAIMLVFCRQRRSNYSIMPWESLWNWLNRLVLVPTLCEGFSQKISRWQICPRCWVKEWRLAWNAYTFASLSPKNWRIIYEQHARVLARPKAWTGCKGIHGQWLQSNAWVFVRGIAFRFGELQAWFNSDQRRRRHHSWSLSLKSETGRHTVLWFLWNRERLKRLSISLGNSSEDGEKTDWKARRDAARSA